MKSIKAIWIDGPILDWNEKEQKYHHKSEEMVTLKKLDNSKDINPKELNEVNF